MNLRRAPRLIALVLAIGSAAGSLAACGGSATSSANGGTPTSINGRKARTIEVIVPLGTNERINNERFFGGEEVDVMPAWITLRIGDTLLIRNDDWADMAVGPYFVKAGKEVRLTYGQVGRFEGSCPLTKGKRYHIVVTA